MTKTKLVTTMQPLSLNHVHKPTKTINELAAASPDQPVSSPLHRPAVWIQQHLSERGQLQSDVSAHSSVHHHTATCSNNRHKRRQPLPEDATFTTILISNTALVVPHDFAASFSTPSGMNYFSSYDNLLPMAYK